MQEEQILGSVGDRNDVGPLGIGDVVGRHSQLGGAFNLHEFLAMHDLSKYEDMFEQHELDHPSVIKELTEAHLDQMGVKTVGGKLRIMAAIKALQPQPLPLFMLPTRSQQPSPQPRSSRKPPRCINCCMYKMKSIDPKERHKCNPELLGHSWADCPTKFERAHKGEGMMDKERRASPASSRGNKRKRGEDKQPVQELPVLVMPPGWDEFLAQYSERLVQRDATLFANPTPEVFTRTSVALAAQYDTLRTIYQQQHNEFGKGKHRKKVRLDALAAASKLLDKSEELLLSEVISEVLGLQNLMPMGGSPGSSGIPPPVGNKDEPALVHMAAS